MKETVLPAGSRAMVPEALKLAWVAVQFGVIMVLARAFQLESPAFYGVVLPLALGGFLIHHWLPRGSQPSFFAALSLAGIGLVFGPVAGAWLVGVGLGLIALCHVPIAFRWRVVLVVLAAGALIAMRATWVPTPWPNVIWPVLGSMFMFRLAIYLYDLKHRGPAGPGYVLSYFFLLPNTVFLLFPVIDFQTFRRTHFDKPAFSIYNEGIRWMFRGLTHLVLYRLIYQYVALSPADVTSTATLVQYLVGNFGLYLRVSGQFHIIVGLLHLFGFRLPETHRFFYLASSFSDLWRRINIYWKDFMQKMVYLPVVFALKRQGETTALVVATMCVVTATWLLHSYQWFWLLGEWLLSATDMAFWGVVGLLLVANTLREQRRGRARQLTAQAPASPHAWRDAVQTAGMFALMAFLWGVWTSPTFEDFRVMLRAATWRMFDVAVVLGTLGVVAAAAYISHRFALGAPSALAVRPRWQHPLAVGALPLALLWIVGQPALEGRVPIQVQVVAQQARAAELNKNDAERMQRGYYEKIVGVNRFNGELWEVYARADGRQEDNEVFLADMKDAVEGDFGIWRRHNDALEHSLIARNRTTFRGRKYTTNRWGMRDKEYDKSRPPNTQRIAVLGHSEAMGTGVNDGETFEALIEERFNREWSHKTGLRYEVLNFAVSGYTLDKQALILQNGRVAEFQPQVVLVVADPSDDDGLNRSLIRRWRRGVDPPGLISPTLGEAVDNKEMPTTEALALLRPRSTELVRWALTNIATEARRIGAQPVYALIPIPKSRRRQTQAPAFVSLAAEAGFIVLDLKDVYAGHEPRTLTVSEADNHPNPKGHQIVADRLYTELVSMPLGIVGPEQAVNADDTARLWAEWNRNQLVKSGAAEVGTPQAEASITPAAATTVTKAPPKAWRIETTDGSAATLDSSPQEGWMRVTVANVSQLQGWQVRLLQAPVPITSRHRYVLNFWMKADGPRPVGCGVTQNVAPWTLLGEYTTVQATAWWQEFTCPFRATETSTNARVFLDLGASKVAVELSGVELRNLSTGDVVIATAQPGRTSR